MQWSDLAGFEPIYVYQTRVECAIHMSLNATHCAGNVNAYEWSFNGNDICQVLLFSFKSADTTSLQMIQCCSSNININFYYSFTVEACSVAGDMGTLRAPWGWLCSRRGNRGVGCQSSPNNLEAGATVKACYIKIASSWTQRLSSRQFVALCRTTLQLIMH